MKPRQIFALTLPLALCLAALVAFLLVAGKPARAQVSTHYVAPGGDCGGVSPCYGAIQDAVDAASDGDVIKVAAGVYSDVHAYPVPPGYLAPPPSGVITQVVYIDRSVTIQGGYSTAFTEPPDSEFHPTILDAQRQGRVLCITGVKSPTIRGLQIKGGDAYDLGGLTKFLWGDQDVGGGVYIISATAVLSGNAVLSNYANHGSGLFLNSSDSLLVDNVIADNLSYDGGLHLWFSASTIRGNTIANNYNRGLIVEYCSGTEIRDNVITGNDSIGLHIFESERVTILDNTIENNRAENGAGLRLDYSEQITIANNSIVGNLPRDSGDSGGGIHVQGSNYTLINNLVTDNRNYGLVVSGVGR